MELIPTNVILSSIPASRVSSNSKLPYSYGSLLQSFSSLLWLKLKCVIKLIEFEIFSFSLGVRRKEPKKGHFQFETSEKSWAWPLWEEASIFLATILAVTLLESYVARFFLSLIKSQDNDSKRGLMIIMYSLTLSLPVWSDLLIFSQPTKMARLIATISIFVGFERENITHAWL